MIDTHLDIEKYFVCQFCHLLVDDPYEKTCCGGLICNNCTKAYICKYFTCHIIECNQQYTIKKNVFAKRLLNQMKDIDCIFKCGYKDSYNKIKSHLMTCTSREFSCYKCNYKGKKQEFKNHFINEHEDEFFKSYNFYINKNINLYANNEDEENKNDDLNDSNTIGLNKAIDISIEDEDIRLGDSVNDSVPRINFFGNL